MLLSATLLTAMLADTIEENEIHNRQRSDGLYLRRRFSCRSASPALGFSPPVWCSPGRNFREGARPDAVAPAVLKNLGWLYILVIVVLYAISIFSITFYRIGRADHAANVLRLGRILEQYDGNERRGSGGADLPCSGAGGCCCRGAADLQFGARGL